MIIQKFDVHGGTDAKWIALADFENAAQAEAWPDDPPKSLEYTKMWWRNYSSFIELHVWLAWDDAGERVIGRGNTRIMHVAHNQHQAMAWIAVRPEYRRQGIGKQLLGRIAEVAQQAGRTELVTWVDSKMPDGAGFAEHIGATAGLLSSTNQLDLAELDRDLMRQWVARAEERATGYELGYWENAWPDSDIEQMVTVLDAMNDAPHDGFEDEKWTVEQLRSYENTFTSNGTTRWTVYARETATSKIAGFSEMFWNPNNRIVANQGDTGVLPQYRNLGLGRWLKAAMALRVLAERPYVRFIRTGNADTNKPMLSINHTMGFKQYKSWTTWTLAVDKALAYTQGEMIPALT